MSFRIALALCAAAGVLAAQETPSVDSRLLEILKERGVINATEFTELKELEAKLRAESDVDATYVATAARIAGAAKVSVLDGGFARWMKDLRPIRAERLRFAVPKAELRGDASIVLPLEEARKRVGDGKTVFLDVRSEEQWSKGRIPGAKNRPWKRDVEDGVFRPGEKLRAELEAAGVSFEKPVVVYCNSGHQASEAFWVLRYVLGHPDVRLYEGSWLEWSMTPGTPRESSAPAEVAPK